MTPDALAKRCAALAADLRWTWCTAAQRLFAALDPVTWEASNHAPWIVLERIAPTRLEAAASDPQIQELVEKAEAAKEQYEGAMTWFERSRSARLRGLRVAYFCSEYAIHQSIPQYSGGLGVLAGDHLKSASDLGIPLCAVGLLYRHGYYRQEITRGGEHRVLYPHAVFENLPVEDTGKTIEVPIGSRAVHARIWLMRVGRTKVYLLDADLEENKPADRELTAGLYKGEPDLRLRQQVLLGVGGVRALAAVGEEPTVVHLNEGHAGFASLERMRAMVVDEGLDPKDALERVRASTVFTTHTPVPAGHDRYDLPHVTRVLRDLLAELGWKKRDLAGFGREDATDKDEPFCMTILALRTASRVNGVSALHGAVSREMWQGAYDGVEVDDVPIGHVTNGIHVQTWLPPEAETLYRRRLRAKFDGAGPRPKWWKRALDLDDQELWELRLRLRRKLVHVARERLAQQARRRGADEDEIADARESLDENALTIGFARRFATYKRAPLVFHDLRRLVKILGNPERPVQILFAGKAHPRDEGGQAYARRVHKMSQRAGLRCRVVLLEEYDIGLGQLLTSGCDIWLNNPIRPHEASGTSGMKPPLVGGLNLSIPDGWWPEGYDGKNGWQIGEASDSPIGVQRDSVDAAALYDLLENEVVPLFYQRNRAGLPKRWIARMKRSMATVPVEFSSARMVAQYLDDSYAPAHRS